MVNHNCSGPLAQMLSALEMEQSLTTEVIVVDSASTDDSVALVRQSFPTVRIIEMPMNRGFAAAANRAMLDVAGDIAIVCSSELVAPVHTLAELGDRVRQGAAARMAVALPRLIDSSRDELPIVGRLPGALRGTLGIFSPPLARRVEVPPLDHVPDHQWALLHCAAFECGLLHRLGGFDERFFRYYYDADVCLRLHERSYRISIQRDLPVVYTGPSERSAAPHLRRLMRLDQHRFFQKHRPTWEQGLLRLDEKVWRLLRPGALDG